MKRYKKFISKLYLKNFFLLFISLELFFTGLDLLQNLKGIINSANLQILYAVNKLLYYANFTIPLALVFAMLLTIFNILKSNELVSMYSLGVSKKDLIRPIMIIASIITVGFITLNTIPAFVDANQKAKNIKKYSNPDKTTSSIFLKSDNNYVYIDKLLPNKKEGEDIKVFVTKNNKLVEILHAKKAKFENNYWNLFDVTSIEVPKIDATLKEGQLSFTNYKTKQTLHGFKPKIIDTLFQEESKLTIPNAIDALTLLEEQNLNKNYIKANLYTMAIFPLFAPIVIYGLFFPLPAQRRGSNIGVLSALYIFSILAIWGLLFTLAKISGSGTVSPEAGIILPIVLLGFASLFIARRYQNS